MAGGITMKKNEKEIKKTNGSKKNYENFTLSLALFDALPVLFFCIGMLLIAARFKNALFIAGAVLCTCAGCGKVLWKILVSSTGKDIILLNRQLRVFMPVGFLLIIAGIIIGRSSIHLAELTQQILSVPTCIFFAITVIGMICMTVFAFTLDGTKARSNWIEQITNAVAQGCLLAGIISMII